MIRLVVPFILSAVVAAPAAAQSLAAEMLHLHNRERAAWRAAPLAWDPALAAGAERWAADLARSGRFQHSPRGQRTGQGENLWMGSAGAYPVRAMAGAWINERRWFRPGVFPAVSVTGDWSHVGHYTQIISRRTTRVGCALRAGRGWNYLVCRYWPSGNVDGLAMP